VGVKIGKQSRSLAHASPYSLAVLATISALTRSRINIGCGAEATRDRYCAGSNGPSGTASSPATPMHGHRGVLTLLRDQSQYAFAREQRGAYRSDQVRVPSITDSRGTSSSSDGITDIAPVRAFYGMTLVGG